MNEIDFLNPAATADIIAWTETDPYERGPFIKTALEDSVLLYIAEQTRFDKHLQLKLGRAHCDNAALLAYAFEGHHYGLLAAMASKTRNAAVITQIVDFASSTLDDPEVSSDSVRSLVDFKKAYVDGRRKDADFIAGALAHPDANVRNRATKYATREQCVDFLKDEVNARVACTNIIARFVDNDEIGTLLSEPARRHDEYVANLEEAYAAMYTNDVKLAEHLFWSCDNSQADMNPALIIVERFGDAPWVQKAISERRRLGFIATNIQDPQVLEQLKQILLGHKIDTNRPSARELNELADALATKLANDVDLAKEICDWNGRAAQNMAEATTRLDVLGVLAGGTEASSDHRVRSSIQARTRSTAVTDTLVEAELKSRERYGQFTERTSGTVSVTVLVHALQHQDTHEAAKAALRQRSAEFVAAQAAAPGLADQVGNVAALCL